MNRDELIKWAEDEVRAATTEAYQRCTGEYASNYAQSSGRTVARMIAASRVRDHASVASALGMQQWIHEQREKHRSPVFPGNETIGPAKEYLRDAYSSLQRSLEEAAGLRGEE